LLFFAKYLQTKIESDVDDDDTGHELSTGIHNFQSADC